MKNVKVAVWGFGAMGSGIVRALLTKKGVDIVGVCDLHPQRVGKSIFEVLDVPRAERADVVFFRQKRPSKAILRVCSRAFTKTRAPASASSAAQRAMRCRASVAKLPFPSLLRQL